MCLDNDDEPQSVETIDRRTFVKHLAGSAALGLVSFPALAERAAVVKAIQMKDLAMIAQPRSSVSLRIDSKDILLVRGSDNQISAFNPICTHKKCKVRFNPLKDRLDCKCHKSSFNLAGEVQGGPAPRDLEVYPTRLDEDKGQLLLKLPRTPKGSKT